MSLYLPDDPTVVPLRDRSPGRIHRAILAREIRLDRERRGVDATGYAEIEAGRGEANEMEDVGF